jgi:hypothetical protein
MQTKKYRPGGRYFSVAETDYFLISGATAGTASAEAAAGAGATTAGAAGAAGLPHAETARAIRAATRRKFLMEESIIDKILLKLAKIWLRPVCTSTKSKS